MSRWTSTADGYAYHAFMKLQLTIVSSGGEPLPPGSPARVELRDTSLADAPAVLLHRVDMVVPKLGRTTALPVTFDFTAVPDGTTVWVHLDVDRDGRVSKGDYITVASYPVANQPLQSLLIRVRKLD